MEEVYIVVGSEGEIEIPEAICQAMEIVDGTRVGVRVDGGLIILTPEISTAKQPAVHE
jgi:antitoxin component of MazEF toxin-antitoxin module